MEALYRKIVWRQFGAAIDTLEQAMRACPDELWGDNSKSHPFWYVTFHTLFWLDFYLSDSPDVFAPPPPFGFEEMDPAGKLPPRTYTKDELLSYLQHSREKCRKVIETLNEEKAQRRFKFGSVDFGIGELLLYDMRHVQHHSAQLNMILRKETGSAPRWVHRAKDQSAGD